MRIPRRVSAINISYRGLFFLEDSRWLLGKSHQTALGLLSFHRFYLYNSADEQSFDVSFGQEVIHLLNGDNRTKTTFGSEQQANCLEKFGESKALGMTSQRSFVVLAF